MSDTTLVVVVCRVRWVQSDDQLMLCGGDQDGMRKNTSRQLTKDLFKSLQANHFKISEQAIWLPWKVLVHLRVCQIVIDHHSTCARISALYCLESRRSLLLQCNTPHRPTASTNHWHQTVWDTFWTTFNDKILQLVICSKF